MRRAWQRWRELTVKERLILLEALLLMPVAGLLLRLLRYQKVLHGLERLTPLGKRQPGEVTAVKLKRVGELVNIAAWRGVYTATCLRRSLVLWWMLRRRGVDSKVRIGVRNDGGEFASHAWVEWEGVVINDRADVVDHYVVVM